ncbi:MAG: hypothetical protein AB7S26_16255 [Sandaracinaceae bacterium]
MERAMRGGAFVVSVCAMMWGCACESPPDVDAGGATPDAALPDAGPGIVDDAQTSSCGLPGRSGAPCRMGMCLTGLSCFGANLRTDLTLGTLGIPSGSEDPAHPGEYLSGAASTVPITVAPGGLCTEGCDSRATTDTCGPCASCNTELGGSPAFGSIGLDAAFFDGDMILGASEDGICRARCNFDPSSDGGCPEGHTCDLLSNTCIERCVSDAQCNVEFGLSLTDGTVAIEAPGTPYTCSATTGRCEHTAPAGAAFGSACARDADCEASNGFCFAGHCALGHCVNSDNDGPGSASCPATGSRCIGFGGNNGSACLSLCNTADDCGADQACDPQTTPIPDAAGTMFAGLCVLPCSSDAECVADHVCDDAIQRFNDASLGICRPFCDAEGTGIAGAVACAADEACVAIGTAGRGVCRARDAICATQETCFDGQACRVEGANLNGRCEDGCDTDADCDVAMMERCVKVDTDPDDGAPQAIGVCIAPGGACSPSPRRTDGTVLRALRGLDGSAQCVPTQRCDAPLDTAGMPMADADGTCVDRS